MTPSLTAEIHTAAPLLFAAAAAAFLAVVAALMRRRVTRKGDVLQVHQLFNAAHSDVYET
jgi:hypothetical protein